MNVERLRTLYAIIAGIPDERVDLDNWRNKKELDCGTIACAVGWACSYPKFVKQGLSLFGTTPTFDTAGRTYVGWYAVEKFFGLTQGESAALFLKSPGRYHLGGIGINSPEDAGLSDKRRVLRRIRHLLLNNGYITKERSAELSVYESTLR